MGLFFRKSDPLEATSDGSCEPSLNEINRRMIDESPFARLALMTRDAMTDESPEAINLKIQGKDVTDLSEQELRALAYRIFRITEQTATRH